jgi:hypothetical protein
MGEIGALSGLMVRYTDSGRLTAMGSHAECKMRRYSVEAAASALLQAVDTVRSRHV